jgi:hypothetical protein
MPVHWPPIYCTLYIEVNDTKNERSDLYIKTLTVIDRTVSFYPLQLTVYPQLPL